MRVDIHPIDVANLYESVVTTFVEVDTLIVVSALGGWWYFCLVWGGKDRISIRTVCNDLKEQLRVGELKVKELPVR